MAKQQTLSFEEYRKYVAHDYMWTEMLGIEHLELEAFIMCDKMTDIIRKYYDAGIPWDEVYERLGLDDVERCMDQIVPMVRARLIKDRDMGKCEYCTVEEYDNLVRPQESKNGKAARKVV